MLSSIRAALVPIHREGYRFIAIFAVVSVVLGLLWSPLGWLGWIATAWCAYFFRDPVRVVPQRAGLLLSPADGRICAVSQVEPPAELQLGDVPRTRISVFMSVLDCHVNRTPIAGAIITKHYWPGTYFNAELDKASENNERQGLTIETDGGDRVGVVQIAGLIARRIVCWSKRGDHIGAGVRFGLIRFGSRVDVYLPAGAHPLVAVGQRAIAGETVFADLNSDEAQRVGRKE